MCSLHPQLVKTAELHPSQNYLFGFHPHGILVLGAFGNFCTEAMGFSHLFPSLQPHLLMLPCCFHLPLSRDYIMCAGERESLASETLVPAVTSYLMHLQSWGTPGPTPPSRCPPPSSVLEDLAVRSPSFCLAPRFGVLRQGQRSLSAVPAQRWPGGRPGSGRTPGGAGDKARSAELAYPDSEGIYQVGAGTRVRSPPCCLVGRSAVRAGPGVRRLCFPRASLVPVFSFGENELFQQFPNPPGSWVRRAQEVMPPLPSVALPLFHGRRGLLLPFRTPIHTVGEPRLCPRAIPQVPHSPRLAFGCNPSPQLCPHDQCRPEGTGPTSQPPPLSSLFCPQWGPRSRCSGTCGPTGRR